MKKIALINPGREVQYAVQEPLHLGFIAAYLEHHDIDVRIIDELAGQDVAQELNRYSPDIVGITATTPLAPDAYRIADLCRQNGMLTVMGGVHASVLPEEALQHVDLVVQGEGEIAMLDIVRNQEIHSRMIARPYIKNLDEIPIPSRHLMQMDFYLRTKDRIPESYLYFVPPNTRTAAILTSRGCPYHCSFCHNTWKGMPYRLKSAELVIAEIQSLIETYKIEALFFIEDHFFINKKRVRTFCDLMRQQQIHLMWGGNSRVDHIDLETLQLVKDAGCRQITFGFESGSQRILDVLNKQTTVAQNRKAIEMCRQVGIIPQGTFMIGNPTETLEDVQATKRFIEETGIESAGICITTPYPGTDLWKWCEEHQLIPNTFNWADFTYANMPIPLSTKIHSDQLKQLQIELSNIVYFQRNKPLKLSKLITRSIQNSKSTFYSVFSLLKNPSLIPAVIKRIRF
jgi:anaerobic magnesium-protoporphyrin IX monomethyl ester cyclase